MTAARSLALSAYYYATLPYRAARNARLRRVAAQPVQVLFYHRVADDRPTPWTMSRQQFARQIEWLRRRFRIVSLATAQRAIANGNVRDRLLAITFDDGYADNCDFAIPLLLREQIPFTYFVTTRHVIDQIPFEHDLDLGYSLRVNTVEQIKSLASAGVEIGAHTRTHCDLGSVASLGRLRDEIAGSHDDLIDITGREIRYFAFPFGQPANLSTTACQVAYEAGFAGVCSAFGGGNSPGGDPFHLRRIHGDPELLRVRNWLTGDPRFDVRSRDFDIGNYRAPLRLPVAEVAIGSTAATATIDQGM